MTQIEEKRKKQIQEFFQEQRRQQVQQDDQQVLYGEAEEKQLFLTKQQSKAVRDSDVRKLSRIEKMFGFKKRGKERETLSMAVSLFKNSREIQKERRTSDLKKSQRNMIAQELQNTDALRAQQISLDHRSTNSLTSDQILENAYINRMLQDDTKQRQDVTGYERRQHAADAQKSGKWVKDTKVMEKDLDNLVENMMKDLRYEAKYEPSEEFAEYREFHRLTRFFEKRQWKLDKEVEQLKKERKNVTGWDATKEQHLLDTQIKYYRIEGLILFVKTVLGGGLQVEFERKYLKAMKRARKQLMEDLEVSTANYTLLLIQKLDARIKDQEKKVETTLHSTLNPALEKEVDSVERANIMRQVMHDIGPSLKLLMDQIQDKEELEKTMNQVLQDHVEGMLLDAGYSLETNQGRKYWKLLQELGYDQTEIQTMLEKQGTSMEKIQQAEQARSVYN